ncbi:MAG: hypothetical protein ACJ77I_04600 [Chloroflexota bacterium]
MTRSDPILAWRIWRLRLDPDRGVAEPVLESCVYGDAWPERAAFAADCPEHRQPVPDCGCGIYAVTARDAAAQWALWAQSAVPHPIVLGRVQLWGRILPYSAGYRAEFAYPYDLEVLPGDGLAELAARRLQRAVCSRYAVEAAGLAA